MKILAAITLATLFPLGLLFLAAWVNGVLFVAGMLLAFVGSVLILLWTCTAPNPVEVDKTRDSV